MTILIKTALGLESVLKLELRDLGIDRVSTEDGAVRLDGDAQQIARMNLSLRTAERVLLEIARFKAADYDTFFERCEQLPWGEYLPKDARIAIRPALSRAELKSARTLQSMSKRAIVNALQRAYRIDRLPENGPEYEVEVFVLKDDVSIALNTSGEGLHRRGYRVIPGEAPLRETLAAAIVILSGWDLDAPLFDPLCGSGTIAIESALMKHGVLPGARREFAAERWPFIESGVWSRERERARDLERPVSGARIFGSDRSEKAVSAAIENAKRSGVGGAIEIVRRDLFQFKPLDEEAWLVSNLPYGERIGDEKELLQLHARLGLIVRDNPTLHVSVLTAQQSFEKDAHRKALRKRKLHNAQIRTDLYLLS